MNFRAIYSAAEPRGRNPGLNMTTACMGVATAVRLSQKEDIEKGALSCSHKSPGDIRSIISVPKLWSS